MATSVHIPKEILDAVDRKARVLEISRNRLIIRALEREITNESGWSVGFFDRLRETDSALSRDVDDMTAAIRERRTSKKPPKL